MFRCIFPSMFVFQGELVSIYSSLRHVAKSGLYSVSMPNSFNFAFDFHLFLILVMLSYIPSKLLSSLLFCDNKTTSLSFPGVNDSKLLFSYLRTTL